MNKENLNSNSIQDFLLFYTNSQSSDQLLKNFDCDSYIIRCKNGSKIHIKKKNKGLFTQYCNGKVTQECIKKGKNSSNPITRKRAIFAENSKKFRH